MYRWLRRRRGAPCLAAGEKMLGWFLIYAFKASEATGTCLSLILAHLALMRRMIMEFCQAPSFLTFESWRKFYEYE